MKRNTKNTAQNTNENTGLRDLRYGNDPQSEEYKKLVFNAYRVQAALVLQHAWRKKKRKPSPENPEQFAISSSMFGLFQEPTDDAYKDYIEKINGSQFTELNFKDKYFIQNVYKCLRLGGITLNQAHFAIQMYQAKQWQDPYDYQGAQFRSYDFRDPKGPYQASDISYATSRKIDAFYDSIKSEPNKEDQCYTIINFNKLQEYLFFRGMITYSLHRKDEKMMSLLKNYLQHFGINYSGNEDLGDLVSQVDQRVPEDFRRAVDDEPRDLTMDLLCAILSTGAENPGVTLSPDYNAWNPNTPTLCFVLTTLTAQMHLQVAVHGEEAVFATHVAGQLTLRMIYALDTALVPDKNLSGENPSEKNPTVAQVLYELYGELYSENGKSTRPVEFSHPNLCPTKNPHGRETACLAPIIIGWHDFAYHAWRSGANFKLPIRILESLLARRGICQESDFIMTRGLSVLIDMDFSHGRLIRKARKTKDETAVSNHVFEYFSWLLFKINAVLETDDLFLRILIDMINDSPKWRSEE